jgi:hypothetical protein
MQSILLHAGAVIITLWGIGHLIPTKNIVAGFGDLSTDNRHVITMEWLAEGMTLIFLGVIVLLGIHVLGTDAPGTMLIARASAGMLVALAILSAFTGARTSVLPMKMCPFIKSAAAVAYVVGSSLA